MTLLLVFFGLALVLGAIGLAIFLEDRAREREAIAVFKALRQDRDLQNIQELKETRFGRP